jgi:FlaA1/EpsC-like NDP-sugar epimerase
MDPNAFTVPFQATKTLRRDVYPTIDPKNPELSAKGKSILITGATGGLGGVRQYYTILLCMFADTCSSKLREPGQSLVRKALYLQVATKRA